MPMALSSSTLSGMLTACSAPRGPSGLASLSRPPQLQPRLMLALGRRITPSLPAEAPGRLSGSVGRAGPGSSMFNRCVLLAASKPKFFALAGASEGVVEVKISGMMCDGCTGRVEEALKEMDGVKSFSVSLEPGGATVELTDPASKADMTSKIVQTISGLGFEVEQTM